MKRSWKNMLKVLLVEAHYNLVGVRTASKDLLHQ